MMQRRKLLNLSQKSRKKTITRRHKARIKRLNILFISLSLFVSVICVALIIILLKSITNKPTLISPLALPNAIFPNNNDRYQSMLEKLLKKNNINYSSIVDLGGGAYEIKLSDSQVAVVTSQKDLNLQISSLQYLLTRLTMEGKRFSRVDLRFDKPVIVLK